MGAKETVEFLIADHGDMTPPSGFRADFARDRPCRSILQRCDNGSGRSLDEVLDMLSWKDDNDAWLEEYGKPGNEKDIGKMVRFRRRVCFSIGCWREFNEDFGRGDVSCLKDIKTPLATSRSPLRAMGDEFNDNNQK